MLKGKYTIELFNNKTSEKVFEKESKNIVYTKALEYNIASAYMDYSFYQAQSNGALTNPKQSKSINTLYNSLNNIILSDRNVDAKEDDTSFYSNVIGFAPKNNTNTAAYDSKKGFLESATLLHNKARFVFKFPDITANGTFNSIMMGGSSKFDYNTVKDTNEQMLYIATLFNNTTVYKDKMYQTFNGYILETKAFDFNGEAIKHICPTSTRQAEGYDKNANKIMPISNNRYVLAIMSNMSNCTFYLLNSNFEKISETVSINCMYYSPVMLYDQTKEMIFFRGDTNKLSISENAITITALSNEDKQSPCYKVLADRISPNIASYIYGDNYVYEVISKKKWSLETGLKISEGRLFDTKYSIVSTEIQGSSYPNMIYFYHWARHQPFSYTKLDIPVSKTSDKFMKITYEVEFTSPMLTQIFSAIDPATPASRATTINLEEEEVNMLDINPPINLHPDEPYGGLIE